jgi:hypothetical protein
VLIDQRGTGQSNALRCHLYDQQNPAVELREFFPLEAVRKCAKELHAKADLTQYSYAHFARDLDHTVYRCEQQRAGRDND